MNPAQHFNSYFDICPANHNGLLEQVFHIRYQVYCREFGYESEQECAGQRETDEYDAHARHCLLIHKSGNRAIGSLRLIEATPGGPPLPFVRYCARSLDRKRFDPDEFPPGRIVEFSRLAVVNQFRRRSTDKGSEISLPLLTPVRDDQRSGFPVIPVSLFLAALSMLLDSDADYGVAMMEPRLMRLLRMYGINFELVGSAMQYHGWRAPYVIHRNDAVRHLKPDVNELFQEIYRSWLKGYNGDRFYISGAESGEGESIASPGRPNVH